MNHMEWHMRSRLWLLSLALVACVSAPASALEKPTLLIRLASVDTLTAKGKYLAKLLDQADLFEQAEGFLKAFTGPRGIDGLDNKKPLGLYGRLGPNGLDSEVVILAPIADQDKFLTFLKKNGFPAEPGKEGLYRIDLPSVPLPGFLRFANGYVYFNLGREEALDEKNLVKPESILPVDQIGLMTVMLDLEQVPDTMRRLALQFIEDQRKIAADKIPDTLNPVEKSLQILLQEFGFDSLKNIVKEGGPIVFQTDIDETKEALSVRLSFAAQGDTKLSKDLAEMGKAASVAAGALPADAVLRGSLNITLPAKIASGLAAYEKNLKAELAKQNDPRVRTAVEGLYDAVMPTVKAGIVDIGFAIAPTVGGKHAIVTTGQVVKGGTIETALKGVLDLIPANDRRKIRLEVDMDKVGKTNVHGARIDTLDAEGKRLLGDGSVTFALRDDALLVAIGERSAEVLKQSVVAAPRPIGVGSLSVSVSKMLGVIPEDEMKRVEPAFKKALMANPKGSDKVVMTLQGGKELRLELTVPALVLQIVGEVAKLK